MRLTPEDGTQSHFRIESNNNWCGYLFKKRNLRKWKGVASHQSLRQKIEKCFVFVYIKKKKKKLTDFIPFSPVPTIRFPLFWIWNETLLICRCSSKCFVFTTFRRPPKPTNCFIWMIQFSFSISSVFLFPRFMIMIIIMLMIMMILICDLIRKFHSYFMFYRTITHNKHTFTLINNFHINELIKPSISIDVWLNLFVQFVCIYLRFTILCVCLFLLLPVCFFRSVLFCVCFCFDYWFNIHVNYVFFVSLSLFKHIIIIIENVYLDYDRICKSCALAT